MMSIFIWKGLNSLTKIANTFIQSATHSHYLFSFHLIVHYSNVVGCLMYSMVCTRPDLASAVSLVSRFMAKPGKQHWLAVKWILRYVRGTLNKGLSYGGGTKSDELISGFVDSDFAGSIDTRKSQTGYVFLVYGSAVSWKAGLQSVVALSTVEAEFIAITEAFKEAKWLKGILSQLGFEQKCVTVHSDSQGAIDLSKHQVFHERSKHFDIRLHFVREVSVTGEVKVIKVGTNENPADVLTKPVPLKKLEFCLTQLKLLSM